MGAQSEQTALEAVEQADTLSFPGTQELHGLQVSATVAPSAVEYKPARQVWHTPDDWAPVVAEYVPAKHWAQSPLLVPPVLARNVPAMQGLHADAP